MENIIKALGKEAFKKIAQDLDFKLWSDVRKAYYKENGKPVSEEDLGEYISDILYYVTTGQYLFSEPGN